MNYKDKKKMRNLIIFTHNYNENSMRFGGFKWQNTEKNLVFPISVREIAREDVMQNRPGTASVVTNMNPG